jgi:threonine dehydratase
VLVTDDEIMQARSSLWSEYRVPSEPGAATAYAALLSGRYVPEDGERIAVVVCGANTDTATLGRHHASPLRVGPPHTEAERRC